MEFGFNEDTFIPLLLFAIPLTAITGGIVISIIRVLGRQRLVELAQRERIAAIERGVDPAKLPALDLGRLDIASMLEFERHGSPLRRAQGLLIGGLVTTFAGVGMVVFLILLHPEENRPVWAVGLIPAFVGAALLLSAWIVWPRGGNTGGPAAG